MKVTGASGIGGGQMNYLTPDEVQVLADWIDQDPAAPESQ